MEVAAPSRAQPADRYAARAVELLHQAHQAGSFHKPANVEHTKTDPDLHAIREHPAYKELIEQLEGIKPGPESEPGRGNGARGQGYERRTFAKIAFARV